jgi:hypothetical protein
MARHRDTKRNRQSRNVLRHRRRIAGLGAATGMFVAAAVAPLATTPAAGADLVNPVVNTVSSLAVFDPPTGTGGGDSTDPTTPGMAGGGGQGGAGGHGGNGGSGGAGGAPGAGGAGGAGGAPGPGGQPGEPGQPGHPGQPGQPG